MMTEHHATQASRRLPRLLVAMLLGAAPGILLILVAQFAINGEPQLTVGTAGLWLTGAGVPVAYRRVRRRDMARTITHAIEIDAPPARVWEVLTDLERYPEWNPFILSANGNLETGGRLTLNMKAAGKTFRVRPTVLEAAEERVLRWIGRLGVRGVFDAEHIHTIERTQTGARYVQQEHFRGVLVPLVGKTLSATEVAFREMNAALKERAERTEDCHVTAH